MDYILDWSSNSMETAFLGNCEVNENRKLACSTISILGDRNKLFRIITFVMRWALLDNVNAVNGPEFNGELR
jgi:hypothetical protein